jgi:hypothetical protein
MITPSCDEFSIITSSEPIVLRNYAFGKVIYYIIISSPDMILPPTLYTSNYVRFVAPVIFVKVECISRLRKLSPSPSEVMWLSASMADCINKLE